VGSLLAALTTLMVTALTLLLAAPYVLDWNQYKYVFEAQASKMIGRAVRIDGNVDLTILPVPEVHLRGVRVADETGSFKTPFAEAENFTATLALGSLLSGTIDARHMQVDQPIIRFQIDRNGRGNWSTLGGGGRGGVPAADLVLHDVAIKDGAIEYRGGPGTAATRIDQISGSFSADSLYGPFRFTGIGAIGRDKRELKISAGKVQNDSTRLKASLSSGTGGSLYQLDGDLKNLTSAIQYTGPVTVRLELGAPVAGKGDKQSAVPRPKAIELKAGSTITLQDARLQEIALTVTENDRPQSFTGSAYASWGESPRLDLSVQTTYLDIDQMVGPSGGKTNPLAAVAVLPQIFEGWAFEPRSGRITASIQQANLGGDTIEGVNFAAAHNREYWQVETLEAKLPGDATLGIRGVLRPGDKIGFTGDFNLSGKHLSRLLHWTAPGLGAVDTGDAQQFSLKGGITFADQRLTFRKATGQLGDSSFSGDLAYDSSADSKLLLTLQSDRLDLRAIYGDKPLSAGMTAEAAPQPEAQPGNTKTSLVDAFRTVFAAKQSQFNLHIAQLTMPDLEARDVRSVFRYENGTLDIREFNFATTDGLSVKADGTLTAFGSTPNGSVNVGVNAPSAASLATFAKMIGLESFGSTARRRMDALAPLRLSGRVGGNREDKTLNLTLAGNAAGSELTFSGRLNGDVKQLRDARVDFGGTIANADGHRLIAQLASDAPLAADAGKSAGAGVLTVSAQGSMSGAGLDSRLELRTPEAEGRFEGKIALMDNPWGLKGALWLRAGQASTALAMLRLSPGGTPVVGDMDVRATITKAAGKLQIDDVVLQLGGQRVAGSASVDISGERPVADIEARAGAIALPKLAAYLVDWDRRDATATTTINLMQSSAASNPWPNQSFAFRSFNSMEGKLRLKAQSIALMDGMTLTNGQFDAALKDGTLTVETFKGQLFSGNFTAKATLATGDGKAVLNGTLKLDKADLGRLTTASDGKPLLRGTGEFRLAFSGEGLSPRGLLTVLNGKGRVRMNKGILYGLQPAVLGSAGDAFLLEEIPQQNKLIARISRELRAPNAQLPFRGFLAPVVLKDGLLEIQRAGFKSPDSLATANLMVDLQAMKLDSEWTVAWRGKTKTGNVMAPVRMVFAGPVASFTSLQPQVITEGLERALSAQRLDRDMDKLEKLGNPNPWQSPAPPSSRDLIAQPPVPNPPTNAAAVPATAPQVLPPTQQTAAPVQPNPPPAQPTIAPAQPALVAPRSSAVAPETQSGRWQADVETSPSGAAQPKPPAASFEDEIRRVLNEQQQQKSAPAQAAPAPKPYVPPEPRSSLSYQTQTYSQTEDVETADNPEETAQYGDQSEAERARAQAVPLPERRSTALKKLPEARQQTPLQQFLNIFQ
jgi:uncharacterized protein involved in outer membrane biogenesis